MGPGSGIDFLAQGRSVSPDGVALSDRRTSWTYRELDLRVSDQARALVGSGVGPGSTAAVVLGATAEAVVAIHALRRAGVRFVPLHPGWTPDERARAVSGAGADVVLDVDEWPPASHAGLPPTEDLPQALGVLWTSGSQGQSRGVELSASAMSHSIGACAQRLDLGPSDRWYASLQPAHVGGLALILRAAALGSTVVATGGFDTSAFAEMVRAGAVSHASLVPVMLNRYLDALDEAAMTPVAEPARGLRAVLVGGAHTPPNTVARALDAGVPVALTWGMTEASSQVATATPAQVAADSTTVGRPLEGVEVMTAETGELWVRGPTLAIRYVGTESSLTDPDGWYHTGDLGRVEEGCVYVTGRASDRIITGGVNVDPSQVEAIVRSLEGVAECVVLGIPDRVWGERVAAAVVAQPGTRLDTALLDEALAPLLARARRVRTWVVMGALPLTANGKVDKQAIRTRLIQSAP